MEQIREEISEVYNKSMSKIKDTKSKFKKIINFINENQEINNQLPSEMSIHLVQLINLWRNNNEANIEYYFKMKDHHSHINGRIENEQLKKMWEDYLKSGMELRCTLLELNELSSELIKYD